MPADPSLSILGPPSLSAGQLQAWLAQAGKRASTALSCTIGQVAAFYIAEGQAQGVRGDVAFAQAVEETGWFAAPAASNLLAKNNFAGIAVPSDFSAGDGWPTPQLGVRAHIQLLAKVVGGNGAHLANPDVAPTWGGRSTSTWGGLSSNWAVDPNYAVQILAIYNTILGGNPTLSTSPDGSTTTGAPPVSPPSGGVGTTRFVNVSPGRIPGIDKKWSSSSDITGSTFSWAVGGSPGPGIAAAAAIADAVTTESTVDLTNGQLSQVQLTVVDPDYSLTGGLPGLISQQSGTVGPYVQWADDILTLAEFETIDTDRVPCAILTLRTGCLQWMATMRVQQIWTGLSATEWIEQCVSGYNNQLPPGVPPATFLGQFTEPNPQIAANASLPVTQWQSFYDIAQQLCYDEGCWLFESGGCVVFGKPTWIATIAPSYKIGWGDVTADVEALNVPRATRSVSVFTGDTIEIDLPRDFGEQARVGQLFDLVGVPYFSSKQWLVTQVEFAYDGGETPVTVHGNEVKDPVPAAPGGVAPSPPQTDPTGHPPQATSVQFVQVAESQVGVPYVWGGEQAGIGFDCSGLVQWALEQLGVTFPRVSGDQYAHCAAVPGANKGPALAALIYGALLFVDSSNGVKAGEHVAISLGQTKNLGTANAQVLVLQAPHPGAKVGTAWVNISYFDEGTIIPELNYGTSGTGQ